jgi:hypothetical protein
LLVDGGLNGRCQGWRGSAEQAGGRFGGNISRRADALVQVERWTATVGSLARRGLGEGDSIREETEREVRME